MQNQNFDDHFDDSLFEDDSEDTSIVDELLSESEEEYTGKLYDEEQYDAVCKERNDFKNKFLYAAAEIENLKKHHSSALIETRWNSAANVLKPILSVLNDFELSIAYNQKLVEDTEDETLRTVSDGFEIIYRKLISTLESLGCKKIEVMPGNDTYIEFDTDYHEAVGTMPVKSEKLNKKIVDVQENGYIYKDRVIRHAKVIVGMLIK